MKEGAFRIILEGDDDTSHFFIIQEFVDKLVEAGFAPREEIVEHLAMFADFDADPDRSKVVA